MAEKPPSGPIQLQKGDLLFDDGAESNAMYVVKTGCIAIVKKKGKSEIELARIMPGQLFGEMAFFDNKPRSAGARAVQKSIVVALPFVALHAQFRKFPEWLKAMVKTVNDNLRAANKRIKTLEQTPDGEAQKFPPHTITRLCGIFGLTVHKYADKEGDNLKLNWNTLRKYTIQIFQEPTHKMETLMEIFVDQGIMEIEKLGEGQRNLHVFDNNKVLKFTEFYNAYLFMKEEKRVTIERREIPILKAMIFYGEKSEPNKDGFVKIYIDQIRKTSVTDLDYLVEVTDYDSLIAKNICTEKLQEKEGVSVEFDMARIKEILPYWELLFAIEDKDRK